MEKIEKYLVDTDIIIDFLRGYEPTRDFLIKLRKTAVLSISVINMVLSNNYPLPF